MIGWQQKSPVALLVFNRPDTTRAVFEVVREVKPPKLLVVADGPRTDRPGEAKKCAAARAIVEQVDWDCEVLTNYSDVNLGSKRRIASGLDWVFSEVEEAILLEDDCVPHPTFFRYCDELLERYRDDERVMSICGNDYQAGRRRTEDSYYFTRYAHVWGWASWRRAWKYYDVEMEHWPRVRDGGWLEDILQDPDAVRYWTVIFQAVYEDVIDKCWDYQWLLSCWLQSGLCIAPNGNLVSNIGFGPDATHTFNVADPLANLPTAALDFPLRHPPFIIRDAVADDFVQRTRCDRGKREATESPVTSSEGAGNDDIPQGLRAKRLHQWRLEELREQNERQLEISLEKLRAQKKRNKRRDEELREQNKRRVEELREQNKKRVEELREQKKQNKRRVEELKEQYQRRTEKLSGRLARTKKKNRNLARQLRSMRASSSWRLLNKLARLQAKVLKVLRRNITK